MKRLIIAILLLTFPASARDLGQWQYSSPDLHEYFRDLVEPDSPIPCCGEADVYWADKTDGCRPNERNCALVAIITDTRDDAPLQRAHIPVGTRIVIPPNKVRHPPSANPTDHNLVFVSPSLLVHCWEPLAGL